MQNIAKQSHTKLFAVLLVPALFFLSGLSKAPKIGNDIVQGSITPEASPEPTRTPDQARLLEPTLPAEVNQADIGAQDYWLNCMPCHGDFGQGLTDDFRQLYPEEDRNCWNRGCHHSKYPNVDGFSIPTEVPAIIGPGLLDKYGSAIGLFAYVHAAMPREAPGSLEDNVYWQLVAFLLRENGYDFPSEDLGEENANLVLMGDQPFPELVVTVIPFSGNASSAIEIISAVHPAPQNSAGYFWLIVAILGAAAFFLRIMLNAMRDED